MNKQRLMELAGVVSEGKNFKTEGDMLRALVKELREVIGKDMDDDKKVEHIHAILNDYHVAELTRY